MSDQVPPTEPSPTAAATPDPLRLGSTSGQRGAEILAGIRADLLRTPVTRALAKPTGRLIGMMVTNLAPGKQAMNFLAVRTNGLAELIKAHLPHIEGPVTIVEMAAGFSPRGLELAQELPSITVVEVDLPDVVAEKQKRLRKIDVPDNMSWRAADLGVTPLKALMADQPVHIVVAEGLLPYFTFDEHIRIARGVHEALQPGGVFIADYGWQEGIDQVQEVASFFARQAGRLNGIFKSESDLEDVLKRAGFGKLDIHRPSEVARKYRLSQPVLDFGLFVVAHKR